MNSKKTIYVIVAILVVVLLGGTIYFVKSRPAKIVGEENVVVTIPANVITSKIYYGDTKYGFVVNLPDSWKGFTTIVNNWTGMSQGATDGVNYISEVGPLILIRNPLWTEKNPRQDIPVMVFTIDQWNRMQSDAFHIGAAPINPSELGRNSKYVFGLPARYNFAYQTGFEEVDAIIQGKSLVAF